MPDGRPTISTHILDTERGFPATGVHVWLRRIESGQVELVGEGTTDGDGRIRDLLSGELRAGEYTLSFELDREGSFFTRLEIGLRIADGARSYHVPLLLAPYALTTYRGS